MQTPFIFPAPGKIACVGEAMIELSLGEELARVGYAGDALNTAIYLARALQQPHSVSFVSAVGGDPLSQRLLGFIADQGVCTDRVLCLADKLPGLYAITTDQAGERSFFYWRENSAARRVFDQGFAALDGFDLIYISAISLAILAPDVRESFLSWLEAWSGIVAFDSNYRPRLWDSEQAARVAVTRAWQRADIGLPSLDDELALFGEGSEAEVLRRFGRYGAMVGALKRGALGPILLDGTEIDPRALAVPSQIVDTTAAGDSFNGAFLAAILSGASGGQAAIDGHALAAKVIGHHGAILPAESQ